MPVTIQLDTSRCVAYGVCVGVAPDYFDLPDGSPIARVLRYEVPDADAETVEDAARNCPAAAISLAAERADAGT